VSTEENKKHKNPSIAGHSLERPINVGKGIEEEVFSESNPSATDGLTDKAKDELSRREFIRMAWTAPVIAAIGLSAPTKTVHAQSSHLDYTDHSDHSDHSDTVYWDHGDVIPFHADFYYDHDDHGDVVHDDHLDDFWWFHWDTHTDGHTDGHADEHGDSAGHYDHNDHSDHNDASLPSPPQSNQVEHGDALHLDVYSDRHDDLHGDRYEDHGDVKQVDEVEAHNDIPHDDHGDHSDTHGDHTDSNPSLDGNDDIESPELKDDNHGDESHMDVTSHDDHLDHIDSS